MHPVEEVNSEDLDEEYKNRKPKANFNNYHGEVDDKVVLLNAAK